MNFFLHHFDYSDQHINAVFMPPAIGPSSNYWKMDMESLLCTIIFVCAVHMKLRLKKELTSRKVLVLHCVTFRSPTSVTRFTIQHVSQPPMNSILKHQQLHHQPGNLSLFTWSWTETQAVRLRGLNNFLPILDPQSQTNTLTVQWWATQFHIQ